MGTRDPRVDAYIENAAAFAQPMLRQFREVVHANCPEVEETLRWNVPSFTYRGMLANMAAFKAHCRIVFWKEYTRATLDSVALRTLARHAPDRARAATAGDRAAAQRS